MKNALVLLAVTFSAIATQAKAELITWQCAGSRGQTEKSHFVIQMDENGVVVNLSEKLSLDVAQPIHLGEKTSNIDTEKEHWKGISVTEDDKKTVNIILSTSWGDPTPRMLHFTVMQEGLAARSQSWMLMCD